MRGGGGAWTVDGRVHYLGTYGRYCTYDTDLTDYVCVREQEKNVHAKPPLTYVGTEYMGCWGTCQCSKPTCPPGAGTGNLGRQGSIWYIVPYCTFFTVCRSGQLVLVLVPVRFAVGTALHRTRTRTHAHMLSPQARQATTGLTGRGRK